MGGGDRGGVKLPDDIVTLTRWRQLLFNNRRTRRKALKDLDSQYHLLAFLTERNKNEGEQKKNSHTWQME